MLTSSLSRNSLLGPQTQLLQFSTKHQEDFYPTLSASVCTDYVHPILTDKAHSSRGTSKSLRSGRGSVVIPMSWRNGSAAKSTHWPCCQRLGVQLPEPTGWFTIACNSNSKESDPLSWCLCSPSMHVIHSYTSRKKTHTHKTK